MAEIISEYPQFFTATNLSWNKLLDRNKYKDVITHSIAFLVNDKRVIVYGFVIMPNHIHLIWRTNDLNGKETPQGSFLKHTAHEFKKMLFRNKGIKPDDFKIVAANKFYEFWQRDSLPFKLLTKLRIHSPKA